MTGDGSPVRRVSIASVLASVSIVGQFDSADIKRTGARQWSARCPFHDDKTASMSVRQFDAKQRYHCFGCGAHGDVIDFVRARDGDTVRGTLGRLSENRDLAVTTPTRRRVPAYLLVCSSAGCTTTKEIESDDVVWLEERAFAWWLGKHRDYCPSCCREKLSQEGSLALVGARRPGPPNGAPTGGTHRS